MASLPISEHYESLRGFSQIASMLEKGKFVDLVAVVVNFTEIKSTRGTDMSRSLIVCDPSAALASTGLLVQFYRPSAEELPRPAEGSVIILKQFKLFEFRGSMQAWSSNSSEWIIFDANGTRILSRSHKFISDPTEDVQTYVIRLAGWWKTRSGRSLTTEIAPPQNLNSATAHSTGRSTLAIREAREGLFFDVYGYIVKTYPSRENAFTVYITDYTKNPQLHDYIYGESKWSGPFGQFTMQITLWDVHAHFAQAHIHDDQYVFLRNVQGKRGDSGRLEGAVRGDRMNPTRVNVIPIASEDPLVKAIKLRRVQYEKAWILNKERMDEEMVQQQRAETALQMTPPTSVNPNLQTSYAQVPTTTVGDILEPPFVPQSERLEGPSGRKRPHKYRTVARIIDFWPPDLRDFSRPYCMACQATFAPANPRPDTHTTGMGDGGEHIQQICTLCGALRDKDDPDTYEFSFTVLLEGQDSVCLPLIFSGDDVETLLGEDVVPCDLYLPENAPMLARLREKLFLLWGGLEESFNGTSGAPTNKKGKGERRKDDPDWQRRDRAAVEQEQPMMWNEVCVMEYWVNEAGGKAGWNGRRFRGFGMAIV